MTMVKRAHVVVGVDGSPSSKAALRWGARLATSLGGDLEVVTAWEYPVSFGWSPPLPSDWSAENDALTVAQDAVDEVFGAQRPEHLTLTAREGISSVVLIDVSRNADVLVVGSRGHGGVVGLLLGSVSAACAEKAHCPVLVVHEPPAAPGAAAS
jgi:nucleotide-binding universal stress UspA family protein